MLKRLFKRQDTASPRAGQDEAQSTEQGLSTTISQVTGISFYKGHVEHGYSVDNVPTAQECPRCHAPTQQHYANWIYATQIAPRIMFAPAGHFCTKCPTVIVDENMIQAGIKRKFRFQGILGIEYEGKKEPDLFRTWNGQEAVYLFDENQVAVGLSTLGPGTSRSYRRTKGTSSQRRGATKRSGKRKRRKKKR
jgi:hypothetical protein